MANDKQNAKSMVSPKTYARMGYLLILFLFGGVGGWAYFAKIDSAIIANGIIAVESNRKSVQHLEGGIVDAILVREGDFVQQGDVLVRLKNVQAESNLRIYNDRYLIAKTTEARLNAERFLKDEIAFPEHLVNSDDARIVAAITEQTNIFEDRMGVLNANKLILEARIEQLLREQKGLEEQKDAYSDRIKILEAELKRLRDGVASQVVERNRLSAKEETFIDVRANIGRIETEIAKVGQSVGETKLQILQADQQFKERASVEYKDISAQMQEVLEFIEVAEDTLSRLNVRAPVDGTVQNVQIHTSGGIVRNGEPMMEVVPADDQLVINAQVSPIDIDNVRKGLETEVRFTAFQSRFMPVITGSVRNVSADIIQPNDGQTLPHFLAKVDVQKEALPLEVRDKLSAGMPADVLIKLGERTVVDYLISPLADALTRGFREE